MRTEFRKLNLQLFAEDFALNPNATTDSGLSAENKTYYDMTLIDEAQAQLVHDQFGQKRDIPANGGKTIEFRKFASLPKATTPITEGVTPDGKKLSVSKIESTVKQYGDYVTLTDVLVLTAIDNTLVDTTKIIGRQAGLTLDTVTRDILHTGTNVFYCPKGDGSKVTSRATLDATCRLTVDVVKRVVAFLAKNNAPKINGSYVSIIHPYAKYDLTSDPEWIDSHKYANPENLYTNEIGSIAGVRFVESSEALVENDVYCTLFIADGAYGVTSITGGALQTIIKQKGSAGTADPLKLAA